VTSKAILLHQDGVDRVQAALRAQALDGWLLFDFHEQNPIARSLLGLEWTTRRGFVLIPAEGEPVALLHAIEGSYWQHWPWGVRSYSGWRQMEAELERLIAGREKLAMEVSAGSSVPTLDLVPSGIVGLIEGMGATLVNSGNLVSTFYSTWSDRQLELHREGAKTVEAIAREAFQRARDAVLAGSPVSEAALRHWITEELASRGLEHGRDCSVAVDANAANPHYDPGPHGALLEAGSLVLIDLWGKAAPDSVFADQTWMGYLGPELPAEMQEVWEAIRDARDAAISFLRSAHADGKLVRGLEVDDVCRDVITERGFGEYFVHRTGHSIDEHIHGSGPNLDNLETKDDRQIIPGVGFSIEPGIYMKERFGMRTEVDVFYGPDGPEVTTAEPQREVFLLLDA
jgi:Xaa-Pro dipeptidase